MPKRPTARVVAEVCSLCGLDWRRHGTNPTTDTCIRLLKADLAAASAPRPIPYVQPIPYPMITYRPYYVQQWSTGTARPWGNSVTAATNYTPVASQSIPRALAQ